MGWLLSLGKTTSNKKGTTLEQLEIPPLSFFFFFFCLPVATAISHGALARLLLMENPLDV